MQKQCVSCGTSFEASRPSARTCSERCRKRAQRGPGADVIDLPAPIVGDGLSGALTAATRAQLVSVGREDSALGVAALIAAARLDALGAVDTGAGVAALIKSHRESLAEAVKDVKVDDDALEVIRGSAALKLLRRGA